MVKIEKLDKMSREAIKHLGYGLKALGDTSGNMSKEPVVYEVNEYRQTDDESYSVKVFKDADGKIDRLESNIYGSSVVLTDENAIEIFLQVLLSSKIEEEQVF